MQLRISLDKGDPLSKSEIATIARWIKEGAKNDSVAVAALPSGAIPGPAPLAKPPIYSVPPVRFVRPVP